MSSLLSGHHAQGDGPPGIYALQMQYGEVTYVGEAISGSSPRTYEFWVYATDASDRQDFLRSGHQDTRQDFSFWYQGGNVGSRFYQFNGWGADVLFFIDLAVKRWVHHALVYDGSDLLRVYIDGALVVSRSVGLLNTSANPLRWGQVYGPGCNCQLTGLRAWTRALSQVDVVALASKVLPTGEPDVWADWGLTEGSGLLAADRSPAGRDLSLSAGITWLPT